MNRHTRAASVLAVLILALPSAAATWSGMGSSEPDRKDSASFLPFEPTTTPGVIYFNHFSDEFQVLNPNVGALGSRQEPPGTVHEMAMLGQWVDCNQDGFVGVSESALFEYPAQLLSTDQATDICPDGGANNQGGWVTEFLPIGTNVPMDNGDGTADFNSQFNPRMVVDNASIVWGDNGLPDDSKDILSGSCQVNPQHGSYHSTGKLLRFADCTFGLYENYNQIFYGAPDFGVAGQNVPLPGADPSNSHGLAGPDCWGQADCTTWDNPGPWNVQTAGADESEGGKADVVVMDCSQEHGILTSTTAPVTAALAGAKPDLSGVDDQDTGVVQLASDEYDSVVLATELNRVKSPTPSTATDGTVAATATELYEEGADNCNPNDDVDGGFYSCYGATNAEPLCESDSSQSTFGKPKINPDSTMNFSAQNRGHNFFGLPEADTGPSNDQTPQCYGLQRWGCAELDGDFWFDELIGFPTTNPTVSGDVTRGTFGFQQPFYQTFYAHVSSTSGTTPGGSGTYGSTQCPVPAPGAPVQNGWACDTSVWYTHDDGSKVEETAFFPHAVVGQAYELRDVDCYDGSIVDGVPVFAGAGTLGAPC